MKRRRWYRLADEEAVRDGDVVHARVLVDAPTVRAHPLPHVSAGEWTQWKQQGIWRVGIESGEEYMRK
jgi:hypothetical protein